MKSLEEILNDLAFQLVTQGDDRVALKATLEQAAAAAQGSGQQKIASLVHSALTTGKLLPDEISALVQRAQRALQQPDASEGPASDEISENLDRSLLTEYIEKYVTSLDEFEQHVMAEGGGESDDFIRRFLHTLKGDSGSIGLIGMEHCCHVIEDSFTEQAPGTLTTPLMEFRAWLEGYLKALASANPAAGACATFLEHYQELISGEDAAAPQAPSAQDLSALGDLPPGANLELMAELLGQTDAPAAPPPTAPTATSSAAASSATGDSYQLQGEADLLNDFVVEAEEHLGAIETAVLEANGNFNSELVGRIFRAAHSIKGASSYFKLLEIQETSHVTEDLLDQVRDGKRQIDEPLVALLFAYKDLSHTLLQQANEAMAKGGTIRRGQAAAAYMNRVKAFKEGSSAKAPAPTPAASARAESSQSTPAAAEGGDKLDVRTFIKVDTRRLDQLIDTIGEMVIHSSMLIQRCRDHYVHDEVLSRATRQVEKFSRDLQGIGMSMRLIPIRGLFQKMSRLVWDTSRKINKEVKFNMFGEDTELDRTLIDQLADPLMHMVRNALDHGIELPDERERAGKPRAGSVTLSASHSGGNIQIRIVDDGKGLDPEKLTAKAREKGLIGPNDSLSVQEAYQLIFAAGFSTAAKVTDISGRGVGMDVVRRNIEALRGQVFIESAIGQGTTFTIELPLTLAIVDGILVRVGTEKYIIPTVAVIELARPTASTISTALGRGETFHFRGSFLPLYRLGDLFQVPRSVRLRDDCQVVVVEVSGERAAILVDNVLGSCSTVIKSLSEVFEQREGLAGCAILADGEAALILDIRGLMMLARKDYQHVVRAESLTRTDLATLM